MKKKKSLDSQDRFWGEKWGGSPLIGSFNPFILHELCSGPRLRLSAPELVGYILSHLLIFGSSSCNVAFKGSEVQQNNLS